MNRLSPISAIALTLLSSSAFADWHIHNIPNLLDPTASTYAGALESEAPVPDSIGVPYPALLIVRCKDHELSVYVSWPDFLGIQDQQAIRYKIDDAPIQSQLWDSGGANDSAFAPNAKAFLQKIAGAQRLVFEVNPYEKGAEQAAFDLTGIDAVAATALKDCP